MPTPLRHEFKIMLNQIDALSVRSRLAAVMTRDCHAGPNGCYRVRSLYFDNYQDLALNEKLDGVSQREKFRLRFYNDDTDWIRLEQKSKQRGLCGKKSARVSREETGRILCGDYQWMFQSDRPVLQDLAAKMQSRLLRPKTLVEYTREAFVFTAGNVRVTLDSNIRSGLQSINFLDLEQPTVPTDINGLTVLEVKYDAFLPDLIRDIVQLGERQSSAMSKYAACRIYG